MAGSVGGALTAWLWRYVWQRFLPDCRVSGGDRNRRYLLAGRPEETAAAQAWLSAQGVPETLVGRMVWPLDEARLRDRIRMDRIAEVVFCSPDVPFSDMVRWMEACRSAGAEYSSFSENGGKVAGQKF